MYIYISINRIDPHIGFISKNDQKFLRSYLGSREGTLQDRNDGSYQSESKVMSKRDNRKKLDASAPMSESQN